MLLVNGPPGVGKSTMAQHYADDHARALIVDVDAIRMQLRQWRERDETKLVARDLAIDTARAHLVAGHDVIVPQMLVRAEFRDRLALLARQAGSRFVEVMLSGDDDVLVERFRERRRELARGGELHPQLDVREEAIATEIPRLNAELASDARVRGVPVIDTAGGAQSAYGALCDAIARQCDV